MTMWLYTESATSTTHAFFTASYSKVLKSIRSAVTHNAVFCCVVANVSVAPAALITLKI
jgi:hypothetical protein